MNMCRHDRRISHGFYISINPSLGTTICLAKDLTTTNKT
jgi:hypothetical protein